MEFKDYVRIVRAHWVGVLVLVILGVAGAALFDVTQPKVYQASATGFVTAGRSANSADATVKDSLARSRVTSYAAVATSSRVAERVLGDPTIEGLPGVPDSAGALVSDVSVSQPQDTVLVKINARAPTRSAAQALADAWVNALSVEAYSVENNLPVSDPAFPKEQSQMRGLHVELLSSAAPGSLVLPRTRVDLLIGLMVGVASGVAYALIRKQFDRRLRSTDEVETAFGVPVIGTIPQSSHMRLEDGRQLTLAVTASNAAGAGSAAEAFRKLRTNLAFMDVDNPPRVIVVTSPKQSDGKSTIAANLAAAIAIGGQPVTLIDGDLRRPTVADSLALVDGTGLTDVLVGRVTASEVMQDHPDVPGLRVLASGAIPPNPSELLGSQTMRQLMTELAEDAMVIVDAPPLLPVTDAAVLSRSADGAIVVITHGGTLDTELAVSLNHIAQVHGRTLGIVFNRMRRSASGGGYGGEHYRYEYQPEDRRRRLKPPRPRATSTSKA
jgi:capsular exopolysaccharide synthesis family protein